MTDAELAAHLAEIAGRLLLEVRAAGVFSAKALGKAGDQTANQFLVHAVREARPDDGLLSEEEKDNYERLAHERVWIIDPVDGTREYGEERSDWAVHVGLAIGGVASIGAVALPGLGLVLRSDQPRPLAPTAAPPRMVVSRTRQPKKRWQSPRQSAPSWCRWALPGPKQWPWSAVRPRSTFTPAASSNGTLAPRSRWQPRTGSTSAAPMVRRCSTTSPIPICPTC
jgi:hypothetical protein